VKHFVDDFSFLGFIHVHWRICLMELLTLRNWRAMFDLWTILISHWPDSLHLKIHTTIAVARSFLVNSYQRRVCTILVWLAIFYCVGYCNAGYRMKHLVFSFIWDLCSTHLVRSQKNSLAYPAWRQIAIELCLVWLVLVSLCVWFVLQAVFSLTT